PVRVPRLSQPSAKAAAQPYLLVGLASNYTWIYSDKGSGAHMDGTFWRPAPADGYFIIGDYAQGNYGNPTGPSAVVTAINDPGNSLLQPPSDYRQVWNDHGSGGDYDGSIWYPVPPNDFVSVGFVCQTGYNKPSIANYRCVHKSLVDSGPVGNLVWNDQGSGADMDVEVFAVADISGLFVAQGNYQPYTGPCYQFKVN